MRGWLVSNTRPTGFQMSTMSIAEDEAIARAKRQAAARARELATQLSRPEDQQRAIDFASELDMQAAELEGCADAAALPPFPR